MKIDIEILTARIGELVRALDSMTDQFNAQNFELRIKTLRVQNLETALALSRDEQLSLQQAARMPSLPH